MPGTEAVEEAGLEWGIDEKQGVAVYWAIRRDATTDRPSFLARNSRIDDNSARIKI